LGKASDFRAVQYGFAEGTSALEKIEEIASCTVLVIVP
jgi:hypothetical protein